MYLDIDALLKALFYAAFFFSVAVIVFTVIVNEMQNDYQYYQRKSTKYLRISAISFGLMALFLLLLVYCNGPL